MTTTMAKAQVMKCEADVASIQKERTDAEAALVQAQRAASEAGEKVLPQDGDAADAARDERFKLDRAVSEAKSRVLRAGFALRRAESAAKEARERLERLTPHAAAVENYAKAEQALRDADTAIVNLARRLQAQLAEAFDKRDAALAAAVEKFNSLPVDLRTLDVNQPAVAGAYFGGSRPPPSDMLYRVGAVLATLGNAAVEAPHASEGRASKPTPWAEAGMA